MFLHGGPGSNHRFFLPHVLPLSQKFKLVLYDQNGCGKSEHFRNNQYSMNEEVQTLELLRQELKLDKINLFGESWGSILALLYATTYPERVNKILLTAAIGINYNGYITFQKELLKRMSMLDKLKLFWVDKKMKRDRATIEDMLDILDPYYVFSSNNLHKKDRISINRTVNNQIGIDIQRNYDLTSDIHKISDIPILVAQGTNDILNPSKIKQLLIDYVPHAQLIEIENCGHWTVLEKSDEINKIANDFFSK